jgi:hypothetical protein
VKPLFQNEMTVLCSGNAPKRAPDGTLEDATSSTVTTELARYDYRAIDAKHRPVPTQDKQV